MDSQSLVICKKESFIPAVVNARNVDGPSERAAELILLVRRSAVVPWIEVVTRVESTIPQETPSAAVNVIRTGLDDGVDDGTVAASELCAVRVRLNLELSE